jgi:hypothetical protein
MSQTKRLCLLFCCCFCSDVPHQAAPFSRLAGGDAGQLGITLSLAEKVLQLQPDNVNMVSLCCQHYLQLLINDHSASACTAK